MNSNTIVVIGAVVSRELLRITHELQGLIHIYCRVGPLRVDEEPLSISQEGGNRMIVRGQKYQFDKVGLPYIESIESDPSLICV